MVRKPSPKDRKKALREMPEEDPEFQIAPMIDVLLVLLVFFMSISTTEALQTVQGINLPVAEDGAQPKETTGQVIVNIKWNEASNQGTIIISEQEYTNTRQITPILEEAVSRNPAEFRVLVRADQGTRYEFIRQVMVAVAQANISNITFSAVDKEVGGIADAANAPN
jgi:biopolymer transport protein ExbD